MPLLDRPEAANFLRDSRQGHRGIVIGGREMVGNLAKQALVIRDQPALRAPLQRVAEWVEGRPAKKFEPGKEPKDLEHPRTEGHLFGLAGDGIAPRQERRRKMKF